MATRRRRASVGPAAAPVAPAPDAEAAPVAGGRVFDTDCYICRRPFREGKPSLFCTQCTCGMHVSCAARQAATEHHMHAQQLRCYNNHPIPIHWEVASTQAREVTWSWPGIIDLLFVALCVGLAWVAARESVWESIHNFDYLGIALAVFLNAHNTAGVTTVLASLFAVDRWQSLRKSFIHAVDILFLLCIGHLILRTAVHFDAVYKVIVIAALFAGGIIGHDNGDSLALLLAVSGLIVIGDSWLLGPLAPFTSVNTVLDLMRYGLGVAFGWAALRHVAWALVRTRDVTQYTVTYGDDFRETFAV